MTRDYELGFILYPEVSEEEIRATLGRIEQVVATYGGQIIKVSPWGRRRLAYSIDHHRDGYYIFIDMILTPETVAELERILKVSEIVLRYMTRKRDPKAVQREREEREARAAAAANTPAPTGETESVSAEPTPATQEPVAELSEEEMADVPPAIEEESVEA